ncbi:MAG: aminotransferase class V-fold PLP-dependent enzyme [Tindallia sp. MSAO_Bac2]|nr:MAG: aminotransferase class V-fold PLP-dependent enzyme [Tindallia sp. MSAO_Bac2]
MYQEISFASDNCAGVHAEVMKALNNANEGYVNSYGEDAYTEKAVKTFRKHFGEETEIFFVYNGTAANVLGLTQGTSSFKTIYCSDSAHIHVDECGAMERIGGCKVQAIPSADGKISAKDIEPYMQGVGVEHRSQPGVISITQPTEYGTVYTAAEIKALCQFAHEKNMILHMDGARLANAAVSLGMPFRQFTRDCGVDLLSFGGTKNGLMFGEAVLFFNPAVAEDFKYLRKQGMQLHSKMRFIAVQFETLMRRVLWKESAEHANRMAQYLHEKLLILKDIKITKPVQANVVFATLPRRIIPPLQQKYQFLVWNESENEVRLMTSFLTEESHVKALVNDVEKLLHSE